MDHSPCREQDAGFDLESGTGIIHGNEEGSPGPGVREKFEKTIFSKLCDRFMSVDDGLVKLDVNPLNDNKGSPGNTVKLSMDVKVEGEVVGKFTGKKTGKEQRKKASSVKKPPRPPRPPRGFSLDASDQKLIKELAELAMIKRARIERIKVLNQKKALKVSSSSSSNGSLFAMLFTIIFFLVVLVQGQNSGANENGLRFLQGQLNPSATNSVSLNSISSTS